MEKIEYVGFTAIGILFVLMLSLVYFQNVEAEMVEGSSANSPILPYPTMKLSGEDPKIDPIIKLIGIYR